ncbi:hypothetical protein RCH10_000810 [Variovorax sp. GrIS 2.14]
MENRHRVMNDMSKHNLGEHSSIRAESQARRASHRGHAPKVLAEAGLKHTLLNDGAHICIGHAVADFWPGTGLWRMRKPNQSGRRIEGCGVQNLIAYLKQVYGSDL